LLSDGDRQRHSRTVRDLCQVLPLRVRREPLRGRGRSSLQFDPREASGSSGSRTIADEAGPNCPA
jgi:hypothetical protein